MFRVLLCTALIAASNPAVRAQTIRSAPVSLPASGALPGLGAAGGLVLSPLSNPVFVSLPPSLAPAPNAVPSPFFSVAPVVGAESAGRAAAPAVRALRTLSGGLAPRKAAGTLRRVFHGVRPGEVREDGLPAVRAAFARGASPKNTGLKPSATAKDVKKFVSKHPPSYDYARMFDLTRRILARPAARKFLKEVFKEELQVSEEIQKEYGLPDRIKEISESQLMMALQYNAHNFDTIEEYLAEMPEAGEIDPEDARYRESAKKWRAKFRELLDQDGMIEVFKKMNDPLRPMHLRTEDGSPGYRSVELFADHPAIENGAEKPAADLKRVLIDFIEGAETELMFNVYEFDLEEVAEALLRKADRGVKITGGIDKNEIHHQKGIKKVFDRLNAHKNITMTEVESVGLNHQKMVIRDWNDKKKAKALFSSGNFTQSGIGPEGDLKAVPAGERPAWSVPNANHMIVMESWLAAQTAANNMIKTLTYGLKGDEYPLGGGFKIFGEKTAGAADEPFMVITFSPKGGLGKLNRDAIRRILDSSRGPVRLLQFVISSMEVYNALVARAKAEIDAGGVFDFKSVGDTPFALRPWSVFLALSGLVFDEKGRLKEYVPMKDNPLVKILGKAAYAALVKNVRIAPPEYGVNYFKSPGRKTVRVSGILHHKVLVSGDWTLSGSFNFTDSAESNNEHMIVFKDSKLAAAMTAIHDGLFSRTGTSVADEARARNAREREKAVEKKKKKPSPKRASRGREADEGEKEAKRK